MHPSQRTPLVRASLELRSSNLCRIFSVPRLVLSHKRLTALGFDSNYQTFLETNFGTLRIPYQTSRTCKRSNLSWDRHAQILESVNPNWDWTSFKRTIWFQNFPRKSVWYKTKGEPLTYNLGFHFLECFASVAPCKIKLDYIAVPGYNVNKRVCPAFSVLKGPIPAEIRSLTSLAQIDSFPFNSKEWDQKLTMPGYRLPTDSVCSFYPIHI